ncbi:hypothetical protein QKU58_gp143 [Pyramimonas orientalis virus]|uniref:Uncharacterized protein n=1 Tax=Pyramimonas orientalis virus 01B TaxID=3134525 RepID=A0A7M3UNE1_9VIRU|nr:hypothetical protein QKU58_gp143 [Pyramimonas orientalis virus]QOI90188.1 hypothetical protein HWQ62_00051 [Pyramimonas orientalis virus]
MPIIGSNNVIWENRASELEEFAKILKTCQTTDSYNKLLKSWIKFNAEIEELEELEELE